MSNTCSYEPAESWWLPDAAGYGPGRARGATPELGREAQIIAFPASHRARDERQQRRRRWSGAVVLALLAVALLVLLALPIRALGGAPLPGAHHPRSAAPAVAPAASDGSSVASSSVAGTP